MCLTIPASATVTLSDDLCTFDSAVTVKFEEVLAVARDFNCSDEKYSVEGPKTWVKIPFKVHGLSEGPIELQGDNNGLTEMAIYAVSKDGSVRSKRYSSQEVTDSWRPKGRYALIVPGSETLAGRGNIQTVYVAITDPKVISSISLMQLAPTKEMDAQQLPLSAMFALLCGLTIMPFFYNAFFYGALRYSFMLWHSVMVVASTVYTFSSSGIIFIAFPETTLTTKFLLNYWTLAIAVFASGHFLIRFVEPGKITKNLANIIMITAAIPVVVTAIVFRIDGGYDMNGRNYYHAAYLPYFLTVLYTMVHALKRGSYAIRFQIFAWLPILFFGFDRVARGMDLYIGIPILDYGLYFMLVFETIILAIGVAHRIMQLRRHHEISLVKQVELTLLAETDGLTAIGNRRGFEKAFDEHRDNSGCYHLAILDIDHFKRVNDTYGHEVGDDVLRVVGRELSKARHYAARIGGEEFALLLKIDNRGNRRENPTSELSKICERLIKAIHKGVPEIKQPVTFSAGVARIKLRMSLKSIMAVADKRLYDAKNNGRNQIVSFDISKIAPQKLSVIAAAKMSGSGV